MADFDLAAARAAGYTDAEIEQVLAMGGRSPREVRALMGAPALGLGDRLAAGMRSILGTQAAPAQAMTRVTHTPVSWGEAAGGAYGSYLPATGAITMDAAKLPQWNANDEYMSNVLRHEQVHALMGDDVAKQIAAYFDAHPDLAATGRQGLAKNDPAAAATNRGLADEAPAYAVQGYRFGMPESMIDEYKSRMSPAQQQQYTKLLKGPKR